MQVVNDLMTLHPGSAAGHLELPWLPLCGPKCKIRSSLTARKLFLIDLLLNRIVITLMMLEPGPLRRSI